LIPFPNKKYNIILADPPWQFKNYSDKWHKDRKESRWVGNEYNCMTINAIKQLPVQKITEDNTVLFLWVTFPTLQQGLEVMDVWGFTYKTCAFNWVKKNKKADSFFVGMGYYTRANSELCLLGTKGKPLERKSRSVQQLVVNKIREHSKKPDSVRDMIVNCSGDLPRIELFSRESTDGWDCWGNEVNKF